MIPKKIFFATTMLLFSVLAFSQNVDSLAIKKITDEVMFNGKAYSNLRVLCKTIGQRLSGSTGMYKAEQWGLKVLTEDGAEKVYLQECMVPHWVRGGKDKAAVFYKNDKGVQQSIPVNVLALGNSIGSGPKGIKAQVVRVNDFDELEAKKNDLKGKIVFYNVPFDDTLLATFQAYGKNVVYRGIGASRAAKYGAVGVMVRSMTNGVDNAPHTGSLRYLDSTQEIPAVAVGVRDVEKMDTLIDAGKSLTAQLFTYGKMLPDTIGHNVIGELTGTEHPDEIITVGGHLDAWDVTEGATDDGAGIVQTIEILRAFKSLGFRPKHTIRFVLFANEENGTRGAKAYADEAKAQHEKHIFALESDAGGFTPRSFSIPINAETKPKLDAWLPLFAPYFINYFTNGGGGADVGPIHETFKVPAAELMPDTQRYFDVHHSTNDVLENVNMRELKLGAINMAALLYLVDKYGL